MSCARFARVGDGDIVLLNDLWFGEPSWNVLLEGEKGVSDDNVFTEQNELIGRVWGDIIGDGDGFLGSVVVVAGGVGVTERDGAVSVTATAYWDSKAIGG